MYGIQREKKICTKIEKCNTKESVKYVFAIIINRGSICSKLRWEITQDLHLWNCFS